MTMNCPQSGPWQGEAGFMYDPTAGALLTRVRADREVAPGLAVFGEVAEGVSGLAAGPAGRIGTGAPSPPLRESPRHLRGGPGFPAVGERPLVTGRGRPLPGT